MRNLSAMTGRGRLLTLLGTRKSHNPITLRDRRVLRFQHIVDQAANHLAQPLRLRVATAQSRLGVFEMGVHGRKVCRHDVPFRCPRETMRLHGKLSMGSEWKM